MNTNVHTKKGLFKRTESIDWESVIQFDYPKIFNYFRYSGLDDETAQELSAVTLEKAWRARKRFDSEKSALTTWLITIAKRTLIDYFRMQRPERSIDQLEENDEPGSDEHNPEQQIQQTEDMEKLRTLLYELPERERDLVALKYGAGMTNREIAKLTELTESNIGTINHRVLNFLRKKLEVKNE